MPVLPSKKVIRKERDGNEKNILVYIPLREFLEKILTKEELYGDKDSSAGIVRKPDAYKNIVDSALAVVCLHARGLKRNGEKLNKQAFMEIETSDGDNEDENKEEKKGVKKLDKAFAEYKGRVDFEVWTEKGLLEDSEREAGIALEEELEKWVVENLANEIATEIDKILERETEEIHISDQKNDDGSEVVEDEWGNLYEHLEKRDDNSQEECESKDFCKRFSRDMMDKLFDFIEKKDGTGGKIKRFYKRDCRYKNRKQPEQSKRDNDWVDDILANRLLADEGEHAVNLVLFFSWAKIDAKTTNDSDYTLEKYVEYIVKRNVKTTVRKESYNAVKIFKKTIELFKDKVRDEKRKAGLGEFESDEFDNDSEELGVPELKELYDDGLEFFYIALVKEFEERCPDIVKKPEF